MTPEDYLQRYIEPFQTLAGTVSPGDWQPLASDYYYPPHSEQGSGLDTLNRTELLDMLQRILAIEYPQQRLAKTTASAFPEVLRRLKDEQAGWQTEMKRLEKELERLEELSAQRRSDNERITAELIEHQTERQRLAVELERRQGESAVFVNEISTLRANLADLRKSTSWKLTKPLRWFGRMVKAMQAPDA